MKKEVEILTESIGCPHCKSVNTEKQGCSNWHDGTGVYYMTCLDCKREWNESWNDNNK